MYQHWPLDKGNWELGPAYPFDNGPTGLCTLAEPAFVSSSGLALAVDEAASPCLHVGLNASPPETVAAHPPLAWGVGVANFDRKLLPAVDAGGGDGALTLQSRGGGYDYPHVAHPLRGWRPGGRAVTDGDAVAAAAPRLVFRVSARDGLPAAARSLVSAFPVRGAAAAPPPPAAGRPDLDHLGALQGRRHAGGRAGVCGGDCQPRPTPVGDGNRRPLVGGVRGHGV